MKDGFGGFGGSNSGASLKYTDDEIDSYSDIFDNAETNVNEEDEQRVIAALKQLSEGTDLESCLDTDALIRYFAAHNFVINYDSYTGNMLHNYYLYEEDGKLTMLPWDYNLAFGGFGGGGGAKFGGNSEGDDKNADKDGFSDATSMINTGIDTPLSGSSEEDRPMWSWIASNEEYLEKYHEVYDELLKNYFENGTFEKEIEVYRLPGYDFIR
jgi:spore coat protein CotH